VFNVEKLEIKEATNQAPPFYKGRKWMIPQSCFILFTLTPRRMGQAQRMERQRRRRLRMHRVESGSIPDEPDEAQQVALERSQRS
jgi:hypothetical protein